MQYYKIQGTVLDTEWLQANDSKETERKTTKQFYSIAASFNQKLNKDGYFFVCGIDEDVIRFGALVKTKEVFIKNIDKFVQKFPISISDITSEEVTLSSIRELLSMAFRRDLINDDDEVLAKFDLDDIYNRYNRLPFDENIIEIMPKEKMYEYVSEYLLEGTLKPELDRIYSGNNKTKVTGHPVSYCIMTDSHDIRNTSYQMLLNALYEKGRIENKRYCYLNIMPNADYQMRILDLLYKSSAGGCIVVRYISGDENEAEYASSDRENINYICEVAEKYRNDVLTIVCLPRACNKLKSRFYENLEDICFVEIKEDIAKNEKAKDYLKTLAKRNHLRPDKDLYSKIKDDSGYLSDNLNIIFNKWKDKKLRTVVYPQYKDFEVKDVIHTSANRPKGSAYNELMSMIGLESAKKVINEAVDFYKAQKLFKDMGMKPDSTGMNLIFEGSAGTCKTTTARLFAEILRDNGILSKGELYETDRSQLVGKYVGWSAKITKDICKKSRGSLLLVDEAYALSQEKEDSFGHEVINTLIKEMEDNREDMCVVFTGYEDKMEQFIASNPGLRSRCQYVVKFEDYTADEMCRIAEYMADDKGIRITSEAMDKLAGIFEEARKKKDFGNGRFVRNILDQARKSQASRLLSKDLADITRDEIETITAEDIYIPDAYTVIQPARRIGFCA